MTDQTSMSTAAGDPGWPPGDEASAALLCARNCILYERDPGPAKLNVATPERPVHIPRSEAWQLSYALDLVMDLDADAQRIEAARVECTSRCVRTGLEDTTARVDWGRAVSLCDAALRMIEGVTAAKGDLGLPVLRAVAKHDRSVVAFGVVEGFAEDAHRDLRNAVRDAGARMSDVPSMKQLVAWAFPWLEAE